jgi:hypothetical protein
MRKDAEPTPAEDAEAPQEQPQPAE